MAIANPEQAEHWNSDEAAHWVAHQDRYERMLAPFATLLLDAGMVGTADRVLDVGCGCGATTIAAARLAAGGSATGVDLSAPMLERARETAVAAGVANITFVQADAQVHPFAPAGCDAVISRFGVMFFADPVAAFANLHRATAAGGRLAFVCWQGLAANEWLVVAGAALAQHVPLPADAGTPNAPGMFGFADPDHVRRVLGDAGWHDVAVDGQAVPVLVAGGGTVDEAVEFLRHGGMARTLLAGQPPDVVSRVLDSVRDALAPYAGPDGVRLGSAVWLVTARA